MQGASWPNFVRINVICGKLVDHIFNVCKIVSGIWLIVLIRIFEISAGSKNDELEISLPCLFVGVIVNIKESIVIK